MCNFISWCSLQPSEQAAWVQAIGSVLAILIAIVIPIITGWLRARKETNLHKERVLNAILEIYDPLKSLKISLEEFYDQTDPDNENTGICIDPHGGNFQLFIPKMVASISLLNDMGDLTPSFRKFLYKLMQLDQLLKMIPIIEKSGAPAFGRTNISDIREKIKNTLEEADNIISKIEKNLK